MTTKRVVIDQTAASPLRISASGTDADSAEFNTLIFDANQMPLRLFATGYSLMNGITWNDRLGGKNVNEGGPISLFTPPAGTTPVFMTVWRRDDGIGRVYTASFNSSLNATSGGGGGGICGSVFCPACFSVGAPGAPTTLPPNTYINYCVFKNVN